MSCSSPSTAPTRFHITKSTVQALPQHRSPWVAAPPALLSHCGPSLWHKGSWAQTVAQDVPSECQATLLCCADGQCWHRLPRGYGVISLKIFEYCLDMVLRILFWVFLYEQISSPRGACQLQLSSDPLLFSLSKSTPL